MLFNSLEYLLFLPCVLLLYHSLPFRLQNPLLLAASYFFYGYWDWRFLLLMILSTCCDFALANALARTETPFARKAMLALSISINLGALGFFKYYNFFADSMARLLQSFGFHSNVGTLHIILPVGISFYTFQSMGYIIDVYRRDIKPIRGFFSYALFVSYFPQLMAGPIERFANLFGQLSNPRTMTKELASEGAYLILWGMFKKILIADNLAELANYGFSNLSSLNFFTALAVIYAFAFQIYCDFSGYTDIARGSSLLLGIRLRLNFDFPYFSAGPSEFWQRWHISLSTWLRDYLYVSLGGNRHGSLRTYRNLMVTMILGGLWHGANWTFLLWGFYQGLLLVAFRFFGRKTGFRPPRAVGAILFFQLVCVGWVFFRASSLGECLDFFAALGRFTPSYLPRVHVLVLIVPLLLMEGVQFLRKDMFSVFRIHPAMRVLFYLGIYLITMVAGKWESNSFIYFQF
ncbi:MAG: putative rane protein involved in D-alanine export [Fibrobacteres bacterium]|nr:putative rane protein involved in D-alanine export [Fibrobacterota bacterium]